MTKRTTFDENVEQELLIAAARVFRQRGYASASLREIASEVGMHLGSLQYRFSTKEALFVALAARGLTQGLAVIEEAIAPTDDPVERLQFAFQAHIRQLLGDDAAYYVLISEWRCLSPEALSAVITYRARYMRFIDDLVEEAARAGALKPGLDPKLSRQFLFGAANWMALVAPFIGGVDADAVARQFWQMFAAGVLMPSGGAALGETSGVLSRGAAHGR